MNTNIVAFGGRAFALVEAGSFPVELSGTLEAQRYNPFDGTLAGSFSGHPHRDALTGEHHAIAYEGGVSDVVRHVVVSEEGRVVRDVPIAVEHGPCIHDCAFTARFAIVLDLPVTFSMRALIAGHTIPFRWNLAHRARVGLLPRGGAGCETIWCDVEPCFVFHVANGYDDQDGRVVLDVVAYDRMFACSGSGLDALGQLERWIIDPTSRHVTRRVLDATPQEFTRIDERRFGQRHRFVYATSVPADGNTQFAGATRLYKHDLETGTRLVHDFGDGQLPGEFVFLPASTNDEDEGWLVGLVIDILLDATRFVVLNARAFEGRTAGRDCCSTQNPTGLSRKLVPNETISPAPAG